MTRSMTSSKAGSSRMRLSKRSQIQMLETIGVVIIIIFLLIIGIVFWNKSRTDDANTLIKDSEDISIITLSKVVSELPDLRCFKSGNAEDVACFDWYKILAMNESMHDSATKDETFQFYRNYFHRSRITFQQVYPYEMNVTVYDNNITANRALKISIPAVFEKNLGKQDIKTFGMIIVEGYYQ